MTMSPVDELRCQALATDSSLHELGNCLNRITLEAALLEPKVPEGFRPALATIRSPHTHRAIWTAFAST